MSVTVVGTSLFARKNTCQNCKRTIVLVATLNSGQVACDPELIAVVTQGAKSRVHARRVHSELCERYKLEDERKKWRDEARKEEKAKANRAAAAKKRWAGK